MKNTVQIILDELRMLSKSIDEQELSHMVEQLSAVKNHTGRIFLAGAGRSGCVVQAFANRLLHLGFDVYLVGSVTTPPITEKDALFIISGSGKTTSLVNFAQQAQTLNSKILILTLQKNGDIAKMATAALILPGTTRLQDKEMFTSIQPIGSSFEQLSWLTCDSLIMLLKEKFKLNNEDLVRNHANLE